jgi:hypothetical protein
MPSGVLDFLEDCMTGEVRPWSNYTTPVEISGLAEPLRLMPAAAGGGTDYAGLVQRLNWDDLYGKHGLGAHLEELRTAWVNEFDLVLVDSRTGVTDFSGLTTAQLPDILAFMFTANRQSLNGSTDIARRAMEARRRMPIDRPALLPLPIPARFEQREEYDRARVWRDQFATDLKMFLDVWAPLGVDSLKLIDLLTIPYVPRWTFGEELAALSEQAGPSGTRTPSQAASFSCETLAALLVQCFARVELLVSSRDEYVHMARSLARSRRTANHEAATRVFISYSRSEIDSKLATENIARSLQSALGEQSHVFYDRQIELEVEWSPLIREEIEKADAYIAVIGRSSADSKRQQEETELFLRQSLRSDQAKTVIPIVLEGGHKAFKASRLADYNALFLDPNIALEHQLATVISRITRLPS